ncbi:rhomboid-related protein 1-like [Achroia grisella]|uniref:rhomboid-related protein 1-like n=1 Tax=Achroia grisella TaxID=688607 RepID=UPI0027D203C3|nr:rhomboid-related protein 1-like [Achroia grisella]
MKLFKSTNPNTCPKMQGVHNNRLMKPPYRGILSKRSPEPAQAWCEDEKKEKKSLLHSPQFVTPSRVRSPSTVTCSTGTQPTLFRRLLNYLKLPYLTICLIVILVTIHLALPEDAHTLLEWPPGPWWREPWRVFTYGFVHASSSHLTINALVAIAVGWRLEIEQGWWRVLLVWSGGVISGALGAGILQPTVRVVGQSAAVYALLMAHIPNVSLMVGSIPYWWFRPLSVVVLLGSEGVWMLLHPAPAMDLLKSQLHVNPVAWSAHLTGAVVGVPLGFLIFKGTEDNIYKLRNRLSRIISVVVLMLAMICAIIYYTISAHSRTFHT